MSPTRQPTEPVQVIQHQAGTIDTVPTTQKADGETVSAGQGRRIREAREAVAACFEEPGAANGISPEHLL